VWCFTTLIPATQEVEIGRVVFQGHSQVWWFSPVFPAVQEAEIGGLRAKAGLDKKYKTLFKTITKIKRIECVDQAVKLLSSTH
jgi:hypothetical protein